MRSGTWPNDSVVTEVSGELTISGVRTTAADLSIRRSIPSSLPAQVAGSGGYAAASGSATILPATSRATDKASTPWGAATPQPMAPAVVEAMAGNARARVFTGLVDKASGKASDADINVDFVDASDALNRPISMRGLCAVMPPPTTDGSTNERLIDLHSTYMVDRVLRECSYYATPPPGGYCVMAATLQGSTWPEIGTLWTSNRDGTNEKSPWWREVYWGIASKSLTADYRPDLAQWSAVDGTIGQRAMEITFCADAQQGTTGRISCQWPDDVEIAVSVTSSRSVLAQVRFSGGDWQTISTATAATLGANWRVATVRFTPTGDRVMSVETRTDTSGAVPAKTASVPYSAWAKPLANINLRWTDNTIGGVQIGFPGKAFVATGHNPTALLSAPVPLESLYVTPVIRSTPAIDLLREWSEAECAAMWIDEDGIFRWVNRTNFVNSPVVWVGTSSNDLLDLTWSHDVQGARRRVLVEYSAAAVSRSKRSRMVVWQGSGQTMDPKDIVEDIIASADDEVWIGVDAVPDLFQADTSKTSFNKGEGSWVGYVGYDKDGEESGNGKYAGYSYEVEYLDVDTWKVTQRWDGSVPTGVAQLKLQTRDGGNFLKPQWQSFDLPVWRAQLKAVFKERALTTSITGPASAPDLVHSAGWWVQTKSQAQSLAYWLAQQTVKPLPVVEGVEVVADPRLQLGDKITVEDSHRTGLQVTGVITEITQDIAAGEHTMTLRLLVTKVMASAPTLYDYDAVWAGAELGQRDQAWGQQTLAQFDTEPLRR